MKYSSRFFLYAPLGVFLILFAIAAIHWWVKASALSDRLAAANGREVMPGVTFAFETRSITGFPFSLDTQFHDVTLAIAAPHGVTRWTAEKFAAHALTYGRDETIFEAAGHQTLQWTGADGKPRSLAFAVGSLRASAIIKNGALARFDFDLVGLGSKTFTAQRLQFHARNAKQGTLEILATADGLTACARHDLRYSGNVARSDALTPLLTGSQSYPLAVAAWRGARGTVMTDKNYLPRLSGVAAEDLVNPSAVAAAICGY